MGLLEMIGLVIAAVVGALFVGHRQGQKAERAKIDKAYRETRGRMDEVVGDDDAVRLRRWLRQRGE